jgi:hypothetical protein
MGIAGKLLSKRGLRLGGRLGCLQKQAQAGPLAGASRRRQRERALRRDA